MKACTAKIQGITPFGYSRWIDPHLKQEKESHEDFDRRIWPEKIHADASGEAYIPPMAFKQALDEASRYLAMKVPGRGKTTYTKHFKSGVLCTKPVMLGIRKDEIKSEQLLMNSDGVRGSGKRVPRIFPVVPSWSGEVEFAILDDIITEEIFVRVLREAGQLIGVGRFRPQNGGYYGRFVIASHQWSEDRERLAA